MRALLGGDIGDDVHPADEKVQKLVVEVVERSPQLEKRSFVWILVGHECVLHRGEASA